MTSLGRRSSAAGRWVLALALVALVCAMPAMGRASGEGPDVSVRVLEGRAPRVLRASPEVAGVVRWDQEGAVPWAEGQGLDVEARADELSVRRAGERTVTCRRLTLSAPVFRIADRRYGGRMTVRATGGALVMVLSLPLESYVPSVVSSEAPSGTPLEGLRAQAVAARSFAVSTTDLEGRSGGTRARPRRSPHASEGYDLCDQTHCQAFRGLPERGSLAWEAARSTRGLVLCRGGRALMACYHSTCGGHTADASEVMPGVALAGVPDRSGVHAWCERSPHFRWTVSIPASDLLSALNADPQTAPGRFLQSVRVLERGREGRATRVEVVGERRRRVFAYDFWLVLGRTLGWGRVESTWFNVRRAAGSFTFEGRGLGHGLGMCQHGAFEMARRGRGFRAILSHYYPSARLEAMR